MKDSNDFSIEHRISTSSFKLSKHYEHVYQGVYVFKGKVRYYIGDKVYTDVHEGNLILLNTLEVHSLEVLEYPYERYIFQMSPTFFQHEVKYPEIISIFIKKPGDFNHCIELPEKTGLYVYQCMIELEREYKNKDSYWDMIVGSDLRRMFIRLFRDCKNQLSKEPIDTTAAIGYKVLHFLDEHFTDDISVSMVADKLFLSKHYIAHAFHAATGYSIIDYTIMLRMNRAKAMLMETNQSISDIAVSCGYTDFTYFTKIFKKNTGVTPRQFRKDNLRITE